MKKKWTHHWGQTRSSWRGSAGTSGTVAPEVPEAMLEPDAENHGVVPAAYDMRSVTCSPPPFPGGNLETDDAAPEEEGPDGVSEGWPLGV